MNNKKKSKAKWKRFSGASYAAFQSLHREVQIGVLSVAMLSSVGLKASAVTVSGTAGIPTSSEEDASSGDSLVVGLEDVEVLASRVPLTQMQAPRQVSVLQAAEIAAAAVHSVNDLLECAAGVDVRQRGDLGVQTDISVRGGTFDQVTILLNGINISSPHTGHLSADFPVSVQDIERIELVQGPAARLFGTSAFTGAINVVTTQPGGQLSRGGVPAKIGGQVHLYGGSYGYAGAEASVSHYSQLRQPGATFSGTGSLGYSRSDGATPNSDFESTRAFYRAQYAQGETQVNMQFGYSYKPFGANTFYGAASRNQWESNERYMGAAQAHFKAGRWHLAPALSWNRWFDHYQWHKGSPLGENYHQVDTWSGMFNSWIETQLGKTSIGLEMRNEGIYSTKLGEPLSKDKYRDVRGHDGLKDSTQYTRHDDRTNLSIFVEHNVLLERWTLSAGVLANRNSALSDKWGVYPGLDIAWRPDNYWKFFVSWNMALRMPTFTELYYSGPSIEGNRTLKPERTNDTSIGLRYRKTGVRAEATLFYSHKSNMIDWATYNDIDGESSSGTFHSLNFKLDNVGVEFSADFLPREIWEGSPLRRIGLQYAYIDEHSTYDREIISSTYAMECLRHKVVVQAETRLVGRLNLSATWRWQEREGAGNRPYGLVSGRLSWDEVKWRAYVECNNLLDKEYFDYTFIPQPGRTLCAGVSVKF